jgi:hypothetical protein
MPQPGVRNKIKSVRLKHWLGPPDYKRQFVLSRKNTFRAVFRDFPPPRTETAAAVTAL